MATVLATAGCGPAAPVYGPTCDVLVVDLEEGTLNGLSPTAERPLVEEKLPCWSASAKDGDLFRFGGGYLFDDRGFAFYTGRDFIEVRAAFVGRTLPAPPTAVGADGVTLKPAPWGCLRTERDAGAVRRFALHAARCEEVARWFGAGR